MSIVDMRAVTLVGSRQHKDSVLADLQSLGFLHLLAWDDTASQAETLPAEVRDALHFLETCPEQRRQLHDEGAFDAVAVTQEVLELKPKLHDLEDERDALQERINALKPWGDFQLPPLEDLAGYRLWFYEIPHPLVSHLQDVNVPWQCVHKDNRISYVVALSQNEPTGMPVKRTRTGYQPLKVLQGRLEHVISAIEDVQAERHRLTRWRDLLTRHVQQLEDNAGRQHAAGLSYDDDALFALKAWCPLPALGRLETYAEHNGLALLVQDPQPEDTPPTLLENSDPTASGQDLVTFYMTPNYWLWDPSAVVLYSFALFFAIIVSDAGYALGLGVILLFLWKRLGAGHMRRLLILLTGSSLVWGILAGSYFGFAPPAGSWLERLAIINVRDSAQMIPLTVVLGASHLILANALTIREAFKRFGWSWRLLSPAGWIVALIAGLALYLGGISTPGLIALSVGLAVVATFAGAGQPLLPRILSGAKSLTSITSAFGDTLSYLRLFALGLASASLAITWNDLASQAASSPGPFGNLFALLIFLLGHTLNFVLGMVSGVVHGLRLNFIEFFNWSVSEEGIRYRPFRRRVM
jgi:V/A-type H+-transporting ATPase subunit I